MQPKRPMQPTHPTKTPSRAMPLMCAGADSVAGTGHVDAMDAADLLAVCKYSTTDACPQPLLALLNRMFWVNQYKDIDCHLLRRVVHFIVEDNSEALRVRNDSGRTALMVALSVGIDTSVEYPCCDDPTCHNRRDCAGFLVFVVKTILKLHPGAAEERDNKGMSPLHIAVVAGAPAGVVRVLLASRPEACTDMDSGGHTPLEYALRESLTDEIVHMLVDAGPAAASVWTKDSSHIPHDIEPYFCCLAGDADAVHKFVVPTVGSESPLHLALRGSASANTVKRLLTAWSSLHVSDSTMDQMAIADGQGKTVLHVAVENNASLAVVDMICQTADIYCGIAHLVNSGDARNVTPFELAVRLMRPAPVIERLLKSFKRVVGGLKVALGSVVGEAGVGQIVDDVEAGVSQQIINHPDISQHMKTLRVTKISLEITEEVEGQASDFVSGDNVCENFILPNLKVVSTLFSVVVAGSMSAMPRFDYDEDEDEDESEDESEDASEDDDEDNVDSDSEGHNDHGHESFKEFQTRQAWACAVMAVVMPAFSGASMLCDTNGQTMMHVAAALKVPMNIVGLLLADDSRCVDEQDFSGNVPLHLAMLNAGMCLALPITVCPHVCRMMPTLAPMQDDDPLFNAVRVLIQECKPNKIVVLAILEAGRVDDDGRAVMLSVANNMQMLPIDYLWTSTPPLDLVSRLCQADPNLVKRRDIEGNSPLHGIVKLIDMTVVAENFNNDLSVPLEMTRAPIYHNVQIVGGMLLKPLPGEVYCGFGPALAMVRNPKTGELPLHSAIRYRAHVDIVKSLLLAYPAAATMEDYEGETPLGLAMAWTSAHYRPNEFVPIFQLLTSAACKTPQNLSCLRMRNKAGHSYFRRCLPVDNGGIERQYLISVIDRRGSNVHLTSFMRLCVEGFGVRCFQNDGIPIEDGACLKLVGSLHGIYETDNAGIRPLGALAAEVCRVMYTENFSRFVAHLTEATLCVLGFFRDNTCGDIMPDLLLECDAIVCDVQNVVSRMRKCPPMRSHFANDIPEDMHGHFKEMLRECEKIIKNAKRTHTVVRAKYAKVTPRYSAVDEAAAQAVFDELMREEDIVAATVAKKKFKAEKKKAATAARVEIATAARQEVARLVNVAVQDDEESRVASPVQIEHIEQPAPAAVQEDDMLSYESNIEYSAGVDIKSSVSNIERAEAVLDVVSDGVDLYKSIFLDGGGGGGAAGGVAGGVVCVDVPGEDVDKMTKEQLTDALECGVCLEKMKNMALFCGHMFCSGCAGMSQYPSHIFNSWRVLRLMVYFCAETMQDCPTCRCIVVGRLFVYR